MLSMKTLLPLPRSSQLCLCVSLSGVEVRPFPIFCVCITTKRRGWLMVGRGVCVCVLSVCTMRACLRVIARVHLSLLPRPQRLALHLSSINHRERLLSPSVAIVSGPETVLGCLAAWREEKWEEEEEERKGKGKGKERKEVWLWRKGAHYINRVSRGRWNSWTRAEEEVIERATAG